MPQLQSRARVLGSAAASKSSKATSTRGQETKY